MVINKNYLYILQIIMESLVSSSLGMSTKSAFMSSCLKIVREVQNARGLIKINIKPNPNLFSYKRYIF